MWSRLLPSPTTGSAHGFPIPIRRHAASDSAYTAALLIGCVIGIAMAWQVVLSEGARGRILGGVASFATSVDPVEASEPPGPTSPAARVEGIPERHARPHQYELAPWPETPARPEANLRAEAPLAAKPVAETLPERLVLAEQDIPAEPEPTGEGAPAVELEIVFDINSSFLGPAAIAALRGLSAELSGGRPYQMALRAAVSDDGVKGAKPRDALRYNRWLAERRLDRVAAWLREHATVEFAIEPAFIEHDASRRVTLSARQQP